MNRLEHIDRERERRVRIARDESERLLAQLYRILRDTPAFQRDHSRLDYEVRAHLESRERYAREAATAVSFRYESERT